MKHSTLTCVEQHLSFKVLTVYRHLKAGSIQACWQNGHELGTFGGKKTTKLQFYLCLASFWHSSILGLASFFLTLRHSFGSSSGCLLGISTLTSSGCYRLLYHARIKKCPRSSLACTCDGATSPELLFGALGDFIDRNDFSVLPLCTGHRPTFLLVTQQNCLAAPPPSRPVRRGKTTIHLNLWPTCMASHVDLYIDSEVT